jgi:RHS repeat-associated protein
MTKRYVHLLAGSAIVHLLFALMSAAALVSLPAPVQAANGQCRWEGGPGAPTHADCRAEDCMGNGGFAQCSDPVAAPLAPWTESQLGPDFWIYNMCDQQPAHPAHMARFCDAAGGTWNGSAGRCENMPPDMLGSQYATSDEGHALSITETFAGFGCAPPTSTDDTGWGVTIPDGGFCAFGGTDIDGGVVVREVRRQLNHYSCRSDLGIVLTRRRTVQCPTGYKSRSRFGQLQCFKPEEGTCSKMGNPVLPFSGTKLQVETDYSPSASSGIEFARFYSSAGYYRPFGVTVGNAPDPGAPKLTDHWRHTYDRRLHIVTGSAEVLAIAEDADGTARSFDSSGYEQANEDGAGDRLQSEAGGWRLTLANRSIERYDANGRLQSITSPAGAVTTLTYVNDLLSTVTGPFGHNLQLAHDPQGRLDTVTLPDNGVIEYAYDDYGRLSGVTYPDSNTRLYHYEDPNGAWLLTGITDESNQRFSTYSYDTSGRAIVSEHAGGADRFAFTYGPSNTTTVTDPGGATRTLGFSNVAGVYKGTSSNLPGAGCGIVKQSTFDTNGNLATRTDFNNNQTSFTFDTTRNLETSRTEAFGTPRARTIETEWHPDFRLPAQIDEAGRTTTYTYDTVGNMLTRTVTDTATSQSRTWTYTYNSYGQVLTIDGPRTDVTDVTTYTYHACSNGAECGRIETIEDAAGNTTTFLTYNAHGQPLSMTDANNVAITMTYDARQRLSSRDFGGEMTSITYYPSGLLKRTTLPDGSYLEHTYDAAHRVIGIEDGEGNKISYILDDAGNRTVESVYDPSQTLARTRGAVYDTLGRLLSELDSNNNTYAHTYDLNGNKDGTVDQEARPTTHDYDELNRLVSTLDPMGGLVQYEYSARDELEEVTDARSLTTSYEYNGFGELKQLTSPDTGVTQYTRNAAGNIHQATDARSKTATYLYDALDRVSQIAYADQTITFTYDQGTNGKGRLTSLIDASGSTAWTYTPQGRVANKQQVVGPVTLTVGYAYNSAGQLNQLTTPSGQVIGHTYSDGRPATITVNGVPLLNNIIYEPFGPTRGWSWSNGTLAVREYDLDGRVTTIDSAGLSTYQFNPDGSIQSWSDDSGALPPSTSGLTEFDVDTNSNQLESSTGVDARTYSYDAAGNITNDGTRSFTYNDAGRMVSATNAGVTTAYALNGAGQRVRKTTSGLSTYFFYDEAGHLLGEYGASGSLIQETVWFGDTPVATLRPDGGGGVNVFYVHADHLNTPRRISRPSDNFVVWRWDSDPFGAASADSDPDGDLNAFVYNLRFPGQYFDNESGLHYNYYRDFDSATGRYVQSDPIGLDGGLNTYSYGYSNPLHYFDMFGLDVKVCFYPHGVTHVGFGVGSEPGTHGFYPRRRSPSFPGEVREDPQDEPRECKTIPSKQDQDRCMLNCRLKRAKDPGWYRIGDRQCTSFVRDCMRKCGIPTGIPPASDPWQGPRPDRFFEALPGKATASK